MGSEVVGFLEDDDVVERCPKNRYVRYNEILGKGVSKTVYKGFDEVEGIEVAWSVMTLDDAMKSPENIEIYLLRKLKHDNVIKSYVSWVDEKKKTINMITELFYWGTLRQYREKHKNVGIKAIKNWARQILLGLDYLHTHNPPIIHRDLKCDNVFVNGNSGQVKIGDLGFSTLMLQPTVEGVIGTQEFMAPEVYEGEYNELADIYSFGMCIFELITSEYPYIECTDGDNIYKKVSSGKKPASLSKVKDPQVKEFIEKCLVPASQRLSAKELLKDPFFSLESIKENVHEPVKVDLVNLPKPDSWAMHNKMSCVGGSVHTSSPRCTTVEVERKNEENYIWVKGEKNENDKNDIVVTFRIDYFIGGVETLEFPYNLDVDTARTVAQEMIDQQVLLKEDVDTVAEMLDCLIKQFEPL